MSPRIWPSRLAGLVAFGVAAITLVQPTAAQAEENPMLLASLNPAKKINVTKAEPGADGIGYLELKTGNLLNSDGKIIEDGIVSGNSRNGIDARNNSKYEGEPNWGPLPATVYDIGKEVKSKPPVYGKNSKGEEVQIGGGIDRLVMHLTPLNPAAVHGRSAFEMHAMLNGEDATNGCGGFKPEGYNRVAKFQARNQLTRLEVINSDLTFAQYMVQRDKNSLVGKAQAAIEKVRRQIAADPAIPLSLKQAAPPPVAQPPAAPASQPETPATVAQLKSAALPPPVVEAQAIVAASPATDEKLAAVASKQATPVTRQRMFFSTGVDPQALSPDDLSRNVPENLRKTSPDEPSTKWALLSRWPGGGPTTQ